MHSSLVLVAACYENWYEWFWGLEACCLSCSAEAMFPPGKHGGCCDCNTVGRLSDQEHVHSKLDRCHVYTSFFYAGTDIVGAVILVAFVRPTEWFAWPALAEGAPKGQGTTSGPVRSCYCCNTLNQTYAGDSATDLPEKCRLCGVYIPDPLLIPTTITELRSCRRSLGHPPTLAYWCCRRELKHR